MTVAFADIQAAAERIGGSVERTPTRPSRKLSTLTGAEVWVKYENLQFTASFKERGARNRLAQLTAAERARGVIAASAGNHAQAVAYHGQQLGVPVTIVMPQGSPFVKVEKTRSFGAEVVLEGPTFDDAALAAQRIQAERDLVFVHPFDDAAVIAGQGTCGLELIEDVPDLDAVLVPIGGGGLIAGVAVAVKAMKPGIRVFGVEAAMYPSFAARRRGEPSVCGGATIAEGIAVKGVGDLTFAVANPLVEDVLVVEEEAFEQAVSLFCTIEKTVAEGAGAGGLAGLLAYPERFKGLKVGLILCGGNIDQRLLASVLNRELVREKRLVTYRILGDDRPGMLSAMSAVIGGLNGNIIDVVHNRLALDVPAKGAEFDILVETQDARHAETIGAALKETGYVLRMA